MTELPVREGEAEVVVIIKAAPNASKKSGETVCCAGIDFHDRWWRLFPVSFRTLNSEQKFKRWDIIKFRWRTPRGDNRIESRQIDQKTLSIIGNLRESERAKFLARSVVTNLEAEHEAGRSLALLKPERVVRFFPEKKSKEDIVKESEKFSQIHAQPGFFDDPDVIPLKPCPYSFKYEYVTEGGKLREGTCQDWETDVTYWNWAGKYGEKNALDMMIKMFGEKYPKEGMFLAMGTHHARGWQWLINGVIRCDEDPRLQLDLSRSGK